MMKLLLFSHHFFNYIFSQTEDDIIQIQENSVYWKKGVDKLVLKDGELFYGDYIGNERKKDIFLK